MKLKCLLGHNWDEWEYVSEDACGQVRVCKREGCSKKRTRPDQHIWQDNWRYENNISCAEIRNCERCGHLERRFVHHWDEWIYEPPNSCIQARRCQRCCTKEQLPVDHNWAYYEYESTKSCVKTFSCQRCGIRYTERPEEARHQWGKWEHNGPGSCERIRFCKKCNHSKTRNPECGEHDWGKWESNDSHSCDYWVRTCKRCNAQGYKEETNHNWEAWKHDKRKGVLFRHCRYCGEPAIRDFPIAETDTPGFGSQASFWDPP